MYRQSLFITYGLLRACFVFLFSTSLFGQSILNEKAFYDSLKPHKLYGDIGVGLNIDNGSEQKVFVQHNAKVSYVTQRHLFECTNDLYYNQSGNDKGSNRLLTYCRAALFRHHFEEKQKISEADFFPEFNAAFTYDESRGLNSRMSIAAGLTYHLHRLSWGRLKVGTSLGYENESWRIFERDFLPTFDTLSQAIKNVLQQAFGINNSGNIVKDNWRWNSYLQFVFPIGEKVNISTMGSIQFPLREPYKNPYNIADFPMGNRKDPRITINAEATFSITQQLDFFIKYFLQTDKGQISPFAQKQASNFSQGIAYHF